jgi:hypothetical protein
MKYQIKISCRDRSGARVLKPQVRIGDAAYWQKRISAIATDLNLNEHATVMVAK